MNATFEPGAHVECRRDGWVNAFGDTHREMHRGMWGTVTGARNFYGIAVIELEEFPGDWFWSIGFKRRLDA